jgi:hypothetical protein
VTGNYPYKMFFFPIDAFVAAGFCQEHLHQHLIDHSENFASALWTVCFKA